MHLTHRDQGLSHPGSRSPFSTEDSRSPVNKRLKMAFPARRYKCQAPGCDKSYTAKSSLNNHVRGEHQHELHQCQYCGKQSADQSDARRHQNGCSRRPEELRCNDPVWLCAWQGCTSSGARRDNVKRHMVNCQCKQEVQGALPDPIKTTRGEAEARQRGAQDHAQAEAQDQEQGEQPLPEVPIDTWAWDHVPALPSLPNSPEPTLEQTLEQILEQTLQPTQESAQEPSLESSLTQSMEPSMGVWMPMLPMMQEKSDNSLERHFHHGEASASAQWPFVSRVGPSDMGLNAANPSPAYGLRDPSRDPMLGTRPSYYSYYAYSMEQAPVPDEPMFSAFSAFDEWAVDYKG